MYVETTDLAHLLHVQQIDLEAIRAHKQLDELPQRSVILEARTKKQALETKRTQLKALHTDVNLKLNKIVNEDAFLAEKQHRVQEEINALSGDYRGVEARTKELNGFTKRRSVLEVDLLEVGEELAKIEAVQAQVEKAFSNFDEQESVATQEFIAQGGKLKETISQLEAQRTQRASVLPQDLLDLYTKTAARSGGVGVALLQDSGCGACRMGIEQGRLIDMKSKGNIVPCPHCGRLLILEK